MTLPVTVWSHPQCCYVCRGTGIVSAHTPKSDDHRLIPCPLCAGPWWLNQFLGRGTRGRVA